MVESVGTSAHAVVRAGELSPATEEEGSSCAGTSAHAAVRAGELSLATKEEGSSCAKGPALCPAADDSADAIGAVGGRDEAVCATDPPGAEEIVGVSVNTAPSPPCAKEFGVVLATAINCA